MALLPPEEDLLSPSFFLFMSQMDLGFKFWVSLVWIFFFLFADSINQSLLLLHFQNVFKILVIFSAYKSNKVIQKISIILSFYDYKDALSKENKISVLSIMPDSKPFG